MRSVLLLFEYFHVHLIAHLFAFLIIFFVFGGIFKECSVKKSLFRLFTWDGCEDKFHHGYPKLLLRVHLYHMLIT